MTNTGSVINILFAEDSPADVELALRALGRSGILAVAAVHSTEDAFRSALRAALPDIIISDNSMPQFSSKLAFAAARELAPNVPFIVLSGSAARERAGAEHLRQVTALLDKVDLEQLGSVVTSILSRLACGGDSASTTSEPTVDDFLSLEIRTAHTYLNQAERWPRGEAFDSCLLRVQRVISRIDRLLTRKNALDRDAKNIRSDRDELAARLTALTSDPGRAPKS